MINVLHVRLAGVGHEGEERGMRMLWRSTQRGARSVALVVAGFFDHAVWSNDLRALWVTVWL